MFGSLLGVVMNAIFLSYVRKLEHDKCECAEDKLRDYIKYFSFADRTFLTPCFTLSIKLKRLESLYYYN